MVSKNFPKVLERGSEVIIYACGALMKCRITDIVIRNEEGELTCYVLTNNAHIFPVDLFIKGIEEAQDMKIGDIRWEHSRE